MGVGKTVGELGRCHSNPAFVMLNSFQHPHRYAQASGNPEPKATEGNRVQDDERREEELYNSFLAAGLIWSQFIKDNIWQRRVATCFLLFVAIAGIFGATTVSPRIALVQTVPAVIALVLVWLGKARFGIKLSSNVLIREPGSILGCELGFLGGRQKQLANLTHL